MGTITWIEIPYIMAFPCNTDNGVGEVLSGRGCEVVSRRKQYSYCKNLGNHRPHSPEV
jgi:hypothetical protein